MTVQYDQWVRSLLNGLVAPGSNVVRFSTLFATDAHLRSQGFRLNWREPYGPNNGWMLFYWSAFGTTGQGIVVRIKTHGESAGKPRAFRPHMSVAWMEHGIDYVNGEKHKYSTTGVPESKSPPTGATAAQIQAWADRTHLMFPGFDDSSASNPRGLTGAENLLDEADLGLMH